MAIIIYTSITAHLDTDEMLGEKEQRSRLKSNAPKLVFLKIKCKELKEPRVLKKQAVFKLTTYAFINGI